MAPSTPSSARDEDRRRRTCSSGPGGAPLRCRRQAVGCRATVGDRATVGGGTVVGRPRRRRTETAASAAPDPCCCRSSTGRCRRASRRHCWPCWSRTGRLVQCPPSWDIDRADRGRARGTGHRDPGHRPRRSAVGHHPALSASHAGRRPRRRRVAKGRAIMAMRQDPAPTRKDTDARREHRHRSRRTGVRRGVPADLPCAPVVGRVAIVDPSPPGSPRSATSTTSPTGSPTSAEVLATDRWDAVHILAPVSFHADYSVAVLESGRHCACAVPMATELDGPGSGDRRATAQRPGLHDDGDLRLRPRIPLRPGSLPRRASRRADRLSGLPHPEPGRLSAVLDGLSADEVRDSRAVARRWRWSAEGSTG